MPDEIGQFRNIHTAASVKVGRGVADRAVASDIRAFLFQAADAGQAVALVTLYCVHGAGTRRPGLQMAITDNRVVGSVLGDDTDHDIVRHALIALADGKPHWLTYGDGSPCAGQRLSDAIHAGLLIECVRPGDRAVQCLRDMTAAGKESLWLSDGHDRSCMASTGCMTADNAGELPDGAIWVRYRP